MTTIWVTGRGGVGPLGLGCPALPHEASPGSAPRRVPKDLPLKQGFPPQALRWLDDSSLWWLNAARQANGIVDPDQVPGVAQVVGLGWGPSTPTTILTRTAFEQGFAAMNPALFPFSVGNAPAGQAGIHLKLKGAALTLTAKEGAGLAAMVEACRLVRAGAFSRCLAGGVDQFDDFLLMVLEALKAHGAPPFGEGAYTLALEASEDPPQGNLCRVAAWCSPSENAPPHLFPPPEPLLDRILASLLRSTGWDSESVDLLALPGDTPDLRDRGAAWGHAQLPNASPLAFQRHLGACGASWAGAACLAADSLAAGEAHRAILAAFSTGGAAWGLALEGAGAQ